MGGVERRVRLIDLHAEGFQGLERAFHLVRRCAVLPE